MNAARLRSPVYALCLSILAIAAACGTADVPPKPKASDVGASGSTNTTGGSGGSSAGGSVTAGTGGAGGSGPSAGGGAGTASATGGAGGTDVTGAGGAGGTAAPLGPAIPLPIVVDDIFAPSGFMGDGATPGAIVLANAPTDCPARAPGNAVGKCSKFTYTPIVASLMGWGGVYWQAPANNWGMLPGQHLEAGATKVTFYAAGAKGGEVVTFIAGGIGMGADPYQDPPKVELANQVLTTTMTMYSIDLTGLTYVSIIGGFGWTIEAKPGSDAGVFDPTPVSFYVDGIQWVK